ncbi:hypothetical protein [Pigmentiphaga soli]
MNALNHSAAPLLHQSAPRYLTYPAREWFVEAFGPEELERWLDTILLIEPQRSMSVSVRVPATAGEPSRADAWLRALHEEARLYRKRGRAQREIGEIHCSEAAGWLQVDQFERLLDTLSSGFRWTAGARTTVALDPACVSPGVAETLSWLSAIVALDVNIGFAPVHPGRGADDGGAPAETPRPRGLALAATVRRAAPEASIGIALEYGGAWQPLDELTLRLDAMAAFRPQRVLLRETDTAPGTAGRAAAAAARARMTVLRHIADRLETAGYVRVGPDYYAQPDDPVAVAQRLGCATLTPYGMSALPGASTLALGPAAVGSLGAVYYENQRTEAAYFDALRQGHLPAERGLRLTGDDLLRRAVIQSLACNQFIDIGAIEDGHGVDFGRYFARELAELTPFERSGLIDCAADAIEAVGDGLLVLGALCRVFDSYARRRRWR